MLDSTGKGCERLPLLEPISPPNREVLTMSGAYPTLRVAVFADGANRDDIVKRKREGFVRGFTTNPTLMAKAGVPDYEAFARSVLAEVTDLPISFEVFSDDFSEMERQAMRIGGWGTNVNVKIPITNTQGESSIGLIKKLLAKKLRLNVTAVFTQDQLDALKTVARPEDDLIISIFAGRIADTGVDPMPLMRAAVAQFKDLPGIRILWASPRETLNIYQAEDCGCHIITATDELISRLKQHGKSLREFSLETVRMFHDDARRAGFAL
jgi:transaldolase